jgi:hypothetical protein
MATVDIPSPSVILSKSPHVSPTVQLQPKKPVKPRGSPPSKPPNKTQASSTAKVTQDGAVTKPKQSKSRNGMTKIISGGSGLHIH